MGKYQCKYCGKTESNIGRTFDERTLNQHMNDAHTGSGDPDDCVIGESVEDMFPITSSFCDADTPDGAFFAMAMEFGEL